jgi:probable O-glycosylation ligase (exosortase A-associated)
VFVTMTTMTEKRRIIILTAVVAVSIGFYGIKGGVHTIATGGASRLWGPGGFIGDNNALALALVVTLPLFRYLHAIAHKQWLRWVLIVCMGLILASVIGTQSRGAFLGVSAMLLFMLIKSRQKLVAGLIGLFFVGLVVGFAPDSWTERMQTIEEYEEDGSAMSRLESWGFNLDIALGSPLVGGGFDVYKKEALYKSLVPDATINRSPHSIYFEVLGYHGFVGLALFLALFFATFRMAGSLMKLARGKPDLFWAAELGAMLQVSLVGYAVGGAFLNLAFFDLPYYLMAITVCATAVVQRTLAERQNAPATVPAAGPPFLPSPGPAMGPR